MMTTTELILWLVGAAVVLAVLGVGIAGWLGWRNRHEADKWMP